MKTKRSNKVFCKKESFNIPHTPASVLPQQPGHVSVIPTEASASVAHAGHRLWSPYMVRMKFRTKSGKRCSKMLLRTSLRSCSCRAGNEHQPGRASPAGPRMPPRHQACKESQPHHKPKAKEATLEGPTHTTPSR